MKKQQPQMTEVSCEFAPMPSSKISRTQVQEVARELRYVQQADGAIKEAAVVRRARDPQSPLHSYFTWDDTAAAEKYRHIEAQSLIRQIRLVQVGIPEAEQPVIRAFIHVRAHDKEEAFEGHAYISIERVMEDVHYQQQMLDEAKATLLIFKRKYEDLLMWVGALGSVERVQSKLEKAKPEKTAQRKRRLGGPRRKGA